MTPLSDHKDFGWFPVVAAIMTLAFFSIGELYRFFLGLLAILGLAQLVIERRRPGEQWLTWYIAAFMCIWIPILLSVVGAESMDASLSVALRYLIYPFFGYFLITRFRTAGRPRSLLAGTFAILLLWTGDGLYQLATGVDLMGRESLVEGRLTGMIPGVRLGFVLALFSPVFFHAVRTFGKKLPLLWLSLVPYLVVILYGGSRVSWMLLIVSAVLYTGFLLLTSNGVDWRKIAPRLFLVVSVCGLAVYHSNWLKERFVVLPDLASDDYAKVNAAVSDRLPHWEAAIRMYRANPVNGIGVNGYRDSYARYSNGDETPRGQPHLFLLEVAAETGSIGLIGYGAFLVIVAAALFRLARQRRYEPIPWGISLLVAAFPLSATLSLYAHFMSAMVWYLATLFFGLAAYAQASMAASSTPASHRQ